MDTVQTEFRYLLVRLGRQLKSHDCEGLLFVHKIPKPSDDKCDVGLHALSSLEAMGFFDALSPDKLQDVLSKIGRKDMAQDIKEYKQSALFKKAMKLESEREKENKKRLKKMKKDGSSDGGGEWRRDASAEGRRVAAKLLSGAETASSHEERQWRDMFAMALTQTAQLVEQTQLLHKTIEGHDHCDDQTSRRVEEALIAILTAQEEVESLSMTLKRAVTAAGLRSSRQSEEDLLSEVDENKGEPKGVYYNLKRSNTFDGNPKKLVPKLDDGSEDYIFSAAEGIDPPTKAPLAKASSLFITSTASPSLSTKHFAPVPVPAPVSPVPIPIPTPLPHVAETQAAASTTAKAIKIPLKPPGQPTSPTAQNAATAATGPAGQAQTSATPTTPTTTPKMTGVTVYPGLSALVSASSSTPPPTKAKPKTKPKPTSRSAATASPKPKQAAATAATATATVVVATATVKQKDFQMKLDSLLADSQSPITTNTKATITTTPATTTTPVSATITATTVNDSLEEPASTATLASDFDNEGEEESHIYDDPNLIMEEEGIYMNSSMVMADGAVYQNNNQKKEKKKKKKKKLKKQEESQTSLQDDSGLGAEDKSWGGELVNMKAKVKHKPQAYVNLEILPDPDEYSKLQAQEPVPTGGYTVPTAPTAKR